MNLGPGKEFDRINEKLGEPLSDVPQGSALSVIRSHAEKLVKHMLFCGEYVLKDGGVEGGAAFQEAFRRNRCVIPASG